MLTISTDKIRTDLERVADKVGHTPKRNEYDSYGRFTSQIVLRSCDRVSWWHLILDFGFEPYSPNSGRDDESAFVYVADRLRESNAKTHGNTKIGASSDPRQRIQYYGVNRLDLLLAVKSPNPVTDETKLMAEYREYMAPRGQQRGDPVQEWFYFPNDVRETLLNRLRQLDGLPGYQVYEPENGIVPSIDEIESD